MTGTALLRLNPELQRCLWLELTPTRLVLMPALLALALAGLHLSGVDDLAQWVQYILFFLLVLWGGRLAADSFVEEVAQGTWDVQRLSASNPWAMAWGKLLGGTSYVWYGALLCLLVLPFVRGRVDMVDLATTLVGGLAAQATALLVVLLLHRFDASRRRGSTTLAQMLGIAAAVPSLGPMAALSSAAQGWGNTMAWYGNSIPVPAFTLVNEIIVVAWLFLGIAWLMRLQLGHTPSPWPYLAFTLYQMAFLLGFLFQDGLLPPFAVIAGVSALVAAALTYVSLLASPLYVTDIKRLLRASNWAERWDWLPSWLPVAMLAVVLGAATIAAGGREWTLAAAILALFLRDIALVAAVRLLARRRTAMLLCVLTVLLYWLLPEVMDGIGGDGLKAWIFPTRDAAPVSLIGPWVQAAAALVLAAIAWNRKKGA
jgi:hypothetical protein